LIPLLNFLRFKEIDERCFPRGFAYPPFYFQTVPTLSTAIFFARSLEVLFFSLSLPLSDVVAQSLFSPRILLLSAPSFFPRPVMMIRAPLLLVCKPGLFLSYSSQSFFCPPLFPHLPRSLCFVFSGRCHCHKLLGLVMLTFFSPLTPPPCPHYSPQMEIPSPIRRGSSFPFCCLPST